MPRFESDPTNVTAGIPIFPKGDYEFQVGEPKAFLRQNRAGNDSYGIRFPLTVKEPAEYANQRTLFSAYQHTEGAQSFSKGFVMATLGYGSSTEEEKRFDRDMKGKDWSYDTDTGAVGDMWRECTGQRLICELDVKPNPEDASKEQQEWRGYRPLVATPVA